MPCDRSSITYRVNRGPNGELHFRDFKLIGDLQSLSSWNVYGSNGNGVKGFQQSQDTAPTASPTFDNLTLTADLTVGGDVTVGGDQYLSGYLVFPKAEGSGIKVDLSSPTYPWRDLIGEITTRGLGNDPTFAVYQGSLRQYQFSNVAVRECYVNFHIPHDYVPDSDLFVHVHWSQIVVDTGGGGGGPGDAKWQFEVMYSAGHDQAPFSNPITLFVIQTASSTQYQHLIAEVQLSAAAPTASQLDSNDIEPDGVIVLRMFRDPADGSDTLDVAPFVHYVDIHYQSTSIGTKQKAPDFYV